MLTDINAAIEEARLLRARNHRHYAVRQRRERMYVTRLSFCKKPCWSTEDDYRFETKGTQKHRIVKLEPSDTPLIISLLACGLSQRVVAEKFDVTRGAIRRLITRAKKFDGVAV